MRASTKVIIKEWIESIVIAVVLALFIRTFFIQAFRIPSGSMKPTLTEGDKIMVNKLLYGPKIPFTDIRLPGLREPDKGDIIVFVYPQDRKKDFIKRLIAKGGEEIEISNGNIIVNGEAVEDPPEIRDLYYYNKGYYGRQGWPTSVPKDNYFVLGDNSASSKDSRYWGFVPKKNVIGRAMFIWWPPWRIQILK